MYAISYRGHGDRWLRPARTCLSLVFAAVTATSAACSITIVGGNVIGADSFSTDYTGGFTAVRDSDVNLGQPAFQVTLSGQEVLTELRVIVFGLPTTDGSLRFDDFDYRLDVWERAAYFAGEAPVLHYDLGDPVGLQLTAEMPTSVVPKASFGTAGTAGKNSVTYDFTFDLTQLLSESNPANPTAPVLPAGDWVFGFQSWHNVSTSGSLRVAGAVAEEGPLPLFSRESELPSVLGGQDPDQIFLYWGMALSSVPADTSLDDGDFNRDGVVDAADYTMWRDGLGDTYSPSHYQCWRAGYGESTGVNGHAGDYNADGAVDAADYTVWRDNLGFASESVLNFSGNGLNGVDAGDYAVWRQHFEPSSGSTSLAVPEPSLWCFVTELTIWSIVALQRRCVKRKATDHHCSGRAESQRHEPPALQSIT